MTFLKNFMYLYLEVSKLIPSIKNRTNLKFIFDMKSLVLAESWPAMRPYTGFALCLNLIKAWAPRSI